jgi:hypothetical protein
MFRKNCEGRSICDKGWKKCRSNERSIAMSAAAAIAAVKPEA